MRSPMFRRALSALTQANAGPVALSSTRVAAKTPGGAAREPVVLVHGVLASAATYRSLMRREDFVPEREIIGLDLRNHGASPHVSCGMRYEDMAADVIAFLDREGIERACLVGHSMGGKVCMQLALTEPHRVSELCVVDIAPVGYTPGLDSGDPSTTTNAMLAVDLDACKTRNDIDARLKDTGIRSETVRQFVMANLVPREDDRTRYRWRCNLPQINASFGHIMAFPDTRGRVFEGPTCLIRGGKSKYVPFSTMRGHWLQAEQPEAFSRAVTDWLKDVETSKHSGRRDI